MNWLNAHAGQFAALAAVAVFLAAARPLTAKVSGKGPADGGEDGARKGRRGKKSTGSAWALWLIFAAYVAAGLVLGYALAGAAAWVTSLPGTFGGLVASLGAVLALVVGWHAVKMLVEMVRDVLDGRPDEDARRAALWVPTLLPAGITSVYGLVSHPRGIGTGLTAALMGAITLAYTFVIVKAALKASDHKRLWRWFCVPVTLLAGVVLIPLVAFVDGQLAAILPAGVMLILRVAAGALGLGLLLAAVKDILDRVPDAQVRMFLVYGVPLLAVYGVLTVAHFTAGASSGADLLQGRL